MAWPKGQPRKAVKSEAPAPGLPPAEVAKPPMVEAIRRGYYAGHLREPGERFQLRDAADIGRWMRVL